MSNSVRKLNLSLLVLVLLVTSLVVAACGPAAPAKPTVPSGQAEPTAAPAGEPTAEAASDTLVVGVSADIAGWDPCTAIYWLANEVIINTHDTLVDYGPMTDADGNAVRDVSNVIPRLAESWDISEDGKAITFKLREGVKFSNGDPLTAEAVKANFERVLGVPGLTQFLLTDVAFVTEADQMVVEDELTIAFNLPQPNPMFLKAMQEMNMAISNVAQIKKEAGDDVEAQNEWASNNTTGTGPYLVDLFEPGVQLVLKANPNYWGEAPAYSTIIYKIVPSAENRLLMLRNGDIDVAYEIALKDYAALKNEPNLSVYATPTFGTLFMVAGRHVEPWSNPLLRQALAYAIPYDTIMQEVTYGMATGAPSWVPAGLEGFIPASPYKYDLEKAKSLLAEAGYPEGKGLPTLNFALKQGVPEEESAAVYIQAELAKIGINMEINPLALAAHSEQLAKHELPFTFEFWIPYVPDPVYNIYWTLRTADSGCCNYASYSVAEVDEMIDKSLVELDYATRLGYVKQVQEIVAQDPPQIPLYHPTWNLAMKNNIAGYSYYPDTLVRFADLTPVK